MTDIILLSHRLRLVRNIRRYWGPKRALIDKNCYATHFGTASSAAYVGCVEHVELSCTDSDVEVTTLLICRCR